MIDLTRPTRLCWTTIVAVTCGLWPAPIGPAAGVPDASLFATPASFVEADLWLLPAAGTVPALGAAASELAAGSPLRALPTFARATSHPVLGGYARLYQGRAELALGRHPAAMASARHVMGSQPAGALGEAALWLLADAAESAEQWPDARRALQALADLPASNAAQAGLRLARAAANADDLPAARRAYARIYYELPLSAEATEAASALRQLSAASVPTDGAAELARAERLFDGRRWAEARRAYETAAGHLAAGDRALASLRRAQCDFYLRRYEAARAALRQYLDTNDTRAAEAQYFYLSAVRALGRQAEYLALVSPFVDAHPAEPLAETALNDLATFHILANEDRRAVETFDEVLRRFPSGRFADRAAWKSGWWAYRNGDYDRAIRLFESAAVTFPRADYRPSWLYWAARAHERLGRLDAALAGYQRTVASYRNSYYGRLATGRADGVRARLQGAARPAAPGGASAPAVQVVPGARPEARLEPLIRALLAAGLYDDAVFELRRAERDTGPSSFIGASVAYALHRKGELRPAITAMRRAYPAFMAQGGEALPAGILKVIFPLEYWDLIRRHAALRNLDPYLVAALVAQESTFQADVRSPANAWGLMQILPATGRRYAARLGITRFSTRRLTDPEVNVRIGTTYFSEQLARFGDVAHALAAYNAGENRVERWRGERPDLERDEFIDDIPFPETQNYVKRVLGTADDYRILYGADVPAAVRESRD